MSFDMDTYRRHSAKLAFEDIDFSTFVDQPLAPDTLRCLRYMHDVENHTVCYLRDVLVTRAHRDPDVTSFLTLWNYEEYWHGEAIAQVLAAHDEDMGNGRIVALRQRLSRRDARRPLLFQVGSALTPHLTAVHMTWGAINEWTTQAGYSRLAKLADHPALTELLTRIMRQEGRHIDFYASQAKARLADSPTAQKITRWALRKYWGPVGKGVMPDHEVTFVSRHLFAEGDGTSLVERIDHRVDSLPGLSGLGLMRRAIFGTG